MASTPARVPPASAGVRPGISQVILAIVLLAAVLFGVLLYVGQGRLFLVGAGAVAMVLVVARRPIVGLYVSIALMPLEAAGRLVPDISVLTWAKVALLLTVFAFLAVKLLSGSDVIMPARSWMLYGLYAVALLATALHGVTSGSAWGLVALLGQMALVLLMVNLVRTDTQFRGLLLAVVAGSIPVVIIGLLDIVTRSSVLGTVEKQLYASSVNQVFRITATFYDPNALGRYLGFVLIMTMGMIASAHYRKWLPLMVPLAVGQALCLTYTFSRGALFALMIGTVVYVMWTRTGGSRLIKFFSVLSIVAVVAAMSFEPFVLLLKRVVGSSGSISVDLSRLRIWAAAGEAFTRSPFIGVGPDSITSALGAIVGVPISPHNLYIEILLGVGIVGLFLIAAYVLPLLRAALVSPVASDECRMVVVATVVVLATGLTLHGFRSNELWLAIALLAGLNANKTCAAGILR